MRGVLILAGILAGAAPVTAQRDTTRIPPGVSLETRYTPFGNPALAVRPFTAGGPSAEVASLAATIIENDLRYSDRFRMMPVPAALAGAGPVDYAQWNSLNLVWLVTGDVLTTPTGFRLQIEAHDVVYATVQNRQTFNLPLPSHPDFRMAVHTVSDQIVRWIFNQPGVAATRVAYVRLNDNNTYDLMVVDSDGEGARRLFGSEMSIYSPAWSPDGMKLTYMIRQAEGWRMVERDVASGNERVLHTTAGQLQTPAYSPDGSKIAFASWEIGGFEVFEYDLSRNCCLRQLTDSSQDNLSPSYSPDGRSIVFQSTRTGSHHVYVMPSSGGQAMVLSPFGSRSDYQAPDWGPGGDSVLFHGASIGGYQIMVADASRPGRSVLQLTSAGVNEDPSWALDGRHFAFTSSGIEGQGPGIYVWDRVTGSKRRIASGRRLRNADWSPSLAHLVNTGSR